VCRVRTANGKANTFALAKIATKRALPKDRPIGKIIIDYDYMEV
jgi:hypothetical protein